MAELLITIDFNGVRHAYKTEADASLFDASHTDKLRKEIINGAECLADWWYFKCGAADDEMAADVLLLRPELGEAEFIKFVNEKFSQAVRERIVKAGVDLSDG